MKKGFYSIGSIVILLIAAMIFVIVPALSGTAQNTLPEYGKYNGKPIKYAEGTEFHDMAVQMVQYMEQYRGYDFNNEYADIYYNMAFNQAFRQIIGTEALIDLTEKSGWVPSEKAIDRVMVGYFTDESGEYSPAFYKNTPSDTIRKYRTSIERQLISERAYIDYFGDESESAVKLGGLKSSKNEIEFLKEMGSNLYSFNMAAFDMNTYPDSEKVAFGEKNPELFVKYDVSILTCDNEAKAKEAQKRISSNEITFTDAVTSYSNKTYGDSSNGKIAASYKFQLENAFSNQDDLTTIASLAKGSLSQVIKTATGYSVFYVDGTPVQPDFTNGEVIKMVNSYLVSRNKGHIEDYFTSVAKDFATDASKNFDSACAKYNVSNVELPAMALNYNNTTMIGRVTQDANSAIANALTNQNFLKTAFALKANEVSSPVVLSGSNSVVVLRCAEITKPDVEMSDALFTKEINTADQSAINESIQTSKKIQDNSQAFMKAFRGGSRI